MNFTDSGTYTKSGQQQNKLYVVGLVFVGTNEDFYVEIQSQ